MLEPISALAFEMHAAKGVFALLIGSGVSRSAKIPTGWEITLDLVRQVAVLKGDDPEPDPGAWYERTYNKAPDYSDLLDQLATTQALRQQVIRPYIEPDAEQRARGERLPTAAHKAIAELVAQGYVRVVLTTNFDQLLEQALADLGVRPVILASADHIAGAMPLAHAGPTIIKLHGDYLDTRIRNTLGELSAYEPEIDRLLDQILDGFGLVVCGWSGDWDVALKAAIDRAPSRRFPMVWAARGAPSPAAQALIDRRCGRIVPIDGADQFFDQLTQRVQAIDTFRKPHPLSADLAVAMLKEYLPEPRHRIRAHDLIADEHRRLVDRLEHQTFSIGQWSRQEFGRQTEAYLAAMGPMLPLAYCAGMWSSREQAAQWIDVIKELARRPQTTGGSVPLVQLRALPATLLMYSFGLGAVVGGHPETLGALVGAVQHNGYRSMALGDQLNIGTVVSDGGAELFKALPRLANKAMPGSELVAETLKPIAKRELRDADAFERKRSSRHVPCGRVYLALGGVSRQGSRASKSSAVFAVGRATSSAARYR